MLFVVKCRHRENGLLLRRRQKRNSRSDEDTFSALDMVIDTATIHINW